MTVLLLFVFTLALAAAAAMYVAIRGHHRQLIRIEEIEAYTSPVNLRGFARITDRGEQEFLRASLPPKVFRRLRRERIRIAIEYVKLAARNAAVLINIGEMQLHSSSVDIQTRAKALVDQAFRLRFMCLLAILTLSVSFLFPDQQSTTIFDLISSYERMSDSLNFLSMLTDPVLASRAQSWI